MSEQMARDELEKVGRAINDCDLIKVWEGDFAAHFPDHDPEEAILAYDLYESMWRASLLFSLIALRKVADFAESRGTRSDDLKLSNFGSSLCDLTGQTCILDAEWRKKIDKGIAHLTTTFEPDRDDLEELREFLRAKETLLAILYQRLCEIHVTCDGVINPDC